MTKVPWQIELPIAVISWMLRKTFLLIEKLLVVLKYQFYKRTAVTPSSVSIPWLKLGAIAFLAFIVFKRDLSFSVGMGESGNTRFGGGMVDEVVFHEKDDNKQGIVERVVSSIFHKKDPFAIDPSDDEETRLVKEYITRYKEVAIAEQEKFGIPASIKMAQAIVESNAGTSALSHKTNNHFGIKCFSKTCKKGHCSNFGDDTHKDFFRKYGSVWESWRSHSKLIVEGKYKVLLGHGKDYKAWAHGLKKLGYATAKHYDETLIKKIEKYHLYELDR
jgi:hypothetical protein